MTEPADQDHDRDAPLKHRFYTDLASWWPLISAPEEYAEEAAFAASLLRMANPPTRTVLELGSGGGSNAFHLKSEFELTLVDLSEEMLAVSRQLNPECEHLLGDMRTVRLGRCFDAVFVHDAIDYMTTEADLRRAVTTAYEHCRVGGVAVFVPDDIAENSSQAPNMAATTRRTAGACVTSSGPPTLTRATAVPVASSPSYSARLMARCSWRTTRTSSDCSRERGGSRCSLMSDSEPAPSPR
jgi:trans-aconitate methyltransferase